MTKTRLREVRSMFSSPGIAVSPVVPVEGVLSVGGRLGRAPRALRPVVERRALVELQSGNSVKSWFNTG